MPSLKILDDIGVKAIKFRKFKGGYRNHTGGKNTPTNKKIIFAGQIKIFPRVFPCFPAYSSITPTVRPTMVPNNIAHAVVIELSLRRFRVP